MTPTNRDGETDQMTLGHSHLEHQEWLEESSEYGELETIAWECVESTAKQYARLILDRGLQRSEARAQRIRDDRLTDPQVDSGEHVPCCENNDESRDDGSAADNDVSSQDTSESPAGSGTKNFPAEGFSLAWNNRGLRVRAIDYHSTELLLDWDHLLSLAVAAQRIPVRELPGLGINDVCGKLL